MYECPICHTHQPGGHKLDCPNRSSFPSCDDEFGPIPVHDFTPPRETKRELYARYEAELERIYTNQTRGDFTWLGVLSTFAAELRQLEES